MKINFNFIVLTIVGMVVAAGAWGLIYNNMDKEHADRKVVKQFCVQMSNQEPVCAKFNNTDNDDMRPYYVQECILDQGHYIDIAELPEMMGCFHADDKTKLDRMLEEGLPSVNWQDGEYEKAKIRLLKAWARTIDSTGCERGNAELTSVRCALHAAAMEYPLAYNPAN